MKRMLLLAFAMSVSTSMLAAEGERVTYKSGGETVSGMLYKPAGKGPFPGLVVIHEWYGLDKWVNEQASKLADQGYEALAIDLYRGKVAGGSEEAHELMRGLPEDRAGRDLEAAFQFLASRPEVRKDRIGSIGWCMGGGYSLALALQQPKLAAAVINYGRLVSEPANLKKINAPVLGIFGGQDRGIPVDSVKNFEQSLKSMGKTVEIHIYPDAGHAFQNPNNKAAYREGDAQDAWRRTMEFLGRTLKR